MKILIEIILTFAQIGLLSFGGGYAAMSLVEKHVVTINKWMSYAEFTDIVTIDELTPGPVAVNAATFVGIKMAGLPGAILATFASILPPCIIALIMAKLYQKYHKLELVDAGLSGLRSMVVALIASTTLGIVLNAFFYYFPLDINAIDYVTIILTIISIFILRKYKINPILLMLGCGIVGLIVFPFI